MRSTSAKCVDEYVATVHDQLRTTLWETQAQSTAEAQRQKWYCNQKIGAVDLKPGNLSCLSEGWCLSGKEED